MQPNAAGVSRRPHFGSGKQTTDRRIERVERGGGTRRGGVADADATA
jgi:hypothetical protein